MNKELRARQLMTENKVLFFHLQLNALINSGQIEESLKEEAINRFCEKYQFPREHYDFIITQ